MRIRTIAAVALSFLAASAGAQAATFDAATFTPPAGWQRQEGGDHVTYTRIDGASRTFCMFTVYSSQSASSSPEAGFASEWAALVAASFEAPEVPQPELAVMPGGLGVLTGTAEVSRDGTSYAALLAVLQAGSRIQSVVAVASSVEVLTQYQPQLEAFLASFRFPAGFLPSPPAVSPATPAPAVGPRSDSSGSPATSGSADVGSIRGKGIAGVWMGFRTVMGKYEPEPRWVTFYTDGQVFKDIPRSGLDGFDRQSSKADPGQMPYWATYTWDGARGLIVTPGVRNPIVLKAKAPNQIYLDSDVYYRCTEVDGLRLQGSWTTFADPNDPVLEQRELGKRPLLTFAKDGAFRDEGIFAGFFDRYLGMDPPDSVAGTGSYELKRYTLILHYADGRTKTLAITGLLGGNPAPSAAIIYLGRSRLNLRKE